MVLKYWRFRAVVLAVLLIGSMTGAGAALAAAPAADDVVWDGEVRGLWIDRADGVMAGAVVRVQYYRDGDAQKAFVPGMWTTDSRGLVVITGLPRAIPGAAPVRLDIRADVSTATLDDEGCTTYKDFIAQSEGVMSRQRVLLLIRTTVRSEPFVNCYGIG